MEKKNNILELRSRNLSSVIIFSLVALGLAVFLYFNFIGLFPMLIIPAIYIFVTYLLVKNDNHSFRVSETEIEVINKLKFMEPSITFYYNDIDKIIIENKVTAYNERKIIFYLTDESKMKCGFRGIKWDDLIQLERFLKKRNVNVEYIE